MTLLVLLGGRIWTPGVPPGGCIWTPGYLLEAVYDPPGSYLAVYDPPGSYLAVYGPSWHGTRLYTWPYMDRT